MEWKKLVDRTLGTNFDAPQYDPQKGRDKLVKSIDAAAKQHTNGSTKVPNRTWKLGSDNRNIAAAARSRNTIATIAALTDGTLTPSDASENVDNTDW